MENYLETYSLLCYIQMTNEYWAIGLAFSFIVFGFIYDLLNDV